MISVSEVAELIKKHDNILIVSHQRPDGDCFGSTCGLMMGLDYLGKKSAAYNYSGVPNKLDFIPGVEKISDKLPTWQAELTIFVDCGGVTRVSNDFQPQGFSLNIDHHATNDCFGDYNFVDTKACAVGEQIYDVLEILEVPITQDIANALYTSVSADTGSFRYSTTNAGTFEMAKKLAQHGAKISWISEKLFESKTRQESILQARALSSTKYLSGGLISWAELLWKDYEEVGGAEHEPEGLSTELRSVEGVQLAMLFHETEDGGIRVSLRGKGKFDCAALAEEFGGGGHKNAAGYKSSEGSFLEIRNQFIARAEEIAQSMVADGALEVPA